MATKSPAKCLAAAGLVPPHVQVETLDFLSAKSSPRLTLFRTQWVFAHFSDRVLARERW